MNVHKSEDFGQQTEAQKLRESAFVEKMRSEYIGPVVDEICEAVPGYMEMSWNDRFVSLMLLNEEHQGHGPGLMVDFGGNLWGIAYPGTSKGIARKMELSDADGKVHVFSRPLFTNSPCGIGPRERYAERDAQQTGTALFLRTQRDTLDVLPVTYRVALLAQHICDCITVDFADACKFAATGDASFHGNRSMIKPLKNSRGEISGWNVRIDDLKPSNKFGLWLVGQIRAKVELQEELQEPFISAYGESARSVREEKPYKRTTRASTDLLVDFVDDYLASIGVYPGQEDAQKESRGLRRITWTEARNMWIDKYPTLHDYTTGANFADCYRRARKRRFGGTEKEQ